MIRIVNGKPLEIPDDERVTPEMVSMRDGINAFLRWASTDSPEMRRLREQYRTGVIGRGFDWYADPDVK